MPTRYEFELKGLDLYLEKLGNLFGPEYLNPVITDILNEAQPEIKTRLETALRATSESWTGATAATLFVTPAQVDGNFIYLEFGADTAADPAGLYKEFGRTRQAAEPFLRPTMRSTWLKNKLRAQMRAIFTKMGYDFKRL